MDTIAEQKCLGCQYHRPATMGSIGFVRCVRYPKSESKEEKDWCGEWVKEYVLPIPFPPETEETPKRQPGRPRKVNKNKEIGG